MSAKIAQEKGIVFALMCWGCLTISFNVAAVAAVIPSISRDMGIPQVQVTDIIPSYLIPYGLGALIYAPLTRRWSLRRVWAGAMLVYSASCLFCADPGSLAAFRWGRAAMGVSAAAAIPLGLLLIGRLFPGGVRGRFVGMFFSCSFLASIAGIVLSGWVEWPWLFRVPGVMGVAGGAAALVLRSSDLDRDKTSHVSYLQLLKTPSVRRVFGFIFLLSFLYHGVHKWFGVYLDQVYGLSQPAISGLFLLMAGAGAAGQLLGGVLSDHWGRWRACRIGLALLTVSTGALALTVPLPILFILLVGLSVGWTIGHNGISTILTDFSDSWRPGLAGLNSSVRFLSGGLGFAASRFIVGAGFSPLFLILGAGMAVLWVCLPKILSEELNFG